MQFSLIRANLELAKRGGPNRNGIHQSELRSANGDSFVYTQRSIWSRSGSTAPSGTMVLELASRRRRANGTTYYLVDEMNPTAYPQVIGPGSGTRSAMLCAARDQPGSENMEIYRTNSHTPATAK